MSDTYTYYQDLLNYTDRRLESLSDRQKLLVAGELYLEIAKIIEERANLSLDEWKLKYDPNYSDYIPELFDDLLVNKSNSLELGDLMVDVEKEDEDDLESEAEPVISKPRRNKQVSIEEIIKLSHTEDIEGWSLAIRDILADNSLTLSDLFKVSKLSQGEIVYSLLLGGFQLEQTGEFYDNKNISVKI